MFQLDGLNHNFCMLFQLVQLARYKRQIQISMLGKNRAQINHQGRGKDFSPLKRLDPYPNSQKENHFQNMLNNQPIMPLISPKNGQHSDRMMMERGLNQKSQSQRFLKSPKNMINTDRVGNEGVCCNHHAKKAEFRIFTEDGEEYFCGRCAAQLATQGCEVEPLEKSLTQGMKLSKKHQLPYLPQFQNQPIYHQILDILKLCTSAVGEQNGNIQKFSNLQKQYDQQVDLTSGFYDRLIDIIQEMKTDHLSDLMQQRDKYTQIADIENDNIRENIIEINTIKNDIAGNMEEVLEGITNSGDSEGECRESLEHYRQKLALYRHQTEEQLDSISQVTRYSQPQIEAMIASFENFLRMMWDESQTAQTHEIPQRAVPSNKMNNALTVKNIHQILPRGVNYENNERKRAFRNLQAEEEEENLQERKSPNFKKI